MRERLPYFLAAYAKELRAIFDTLTAYVVSVVALLIMGYLFSSQVFLREQASLSTLIDTAPLLLVFFIPAVTMRLYSEEYKSGTIEVLDSLPLSDGEVLAAKYLGAMTLVTFMLAGTLAYPLTLWIFGEPDPGAVLGSYAGLWLTGALLAAAGTWASSLTRNPVAAFILAFLAGFSLFLLGKLGMLVPPALASLTDFMGLDSHLDSISRGVLDSRDLVYYACMIGFFLYAAFLRSCARRSS
jgi:ABC-2 type transport system permease protein